MLAHGLLNLLFEHVEPDEFIELLDIASGEIRRYRSVEHLNRDFAKPTTQPWKFRPYIMGPDQQPSASRCVMVSLREDGDDPAGEAIQKMILPPSYLIERGLGYEMFWLFKERQPWAEIATIQEAVLKSCQGLVVPNGRGHLGSLPTTEGREDMDLSVQVLGAHQDWAYAPSEIMAATKVVEHVRSRLFSRPPRSADRRAGEAMEITSYLQRLGIASTSVSRIWSLLPIGGMTEGKQHPLAPCINVGKIGQSKMAHPLFTEEGGMTYGFNAYGKYVVADFTYNPQRLLFGEELVFIGTLHTFSRSIEGVQIPKSAFSRADALLRVLKGYDAQWRGSDKDVRNLWTYYRWRWQRNGGDRAKVVKTLGRHGDAWVLPNSTLTSYGEETIYDADVVADRSGTWPNLKLDAATGEEWTDLLEGIQAYLPYINRPENLWPILGWFMATPLKPLLKSNGVRFPHLMLYGMSGAGKTSTIKEIMLPLVGYDDPPQQYDCSLSEFAILKILGSTNATPIFLSEFRRSMLGATAYRSLKHMLLLAYDGGQQEKGRRDLTTESFPLLAPIVLDGEDVERDHAVRMRSLIVNLRKSAIRAGNTYYDAFGHLILYDLNRFASAYIRKTLELDAKAVEQRYRDIVGGLPEDISGLIHDQRIQNNIAVCLLGCEMFTEFMAEEGYPVEMPPVETIVGECLEEVVSTEDSAATSGVDVFLAAVANHVVLNPEQEDFFGIYRPEVQEVWFHLNEAARWYMDYQAAIQGEPLMMGGLTGHIRERVRTGNSDDPGCYILPYKTVRRGDYTRQAYGISLPTARRAGLDIATHFSEEG